MDWIYFENLQYATVSSSSSTLTCNVHGPKFGVTWPI